MSRFSIDILPITIEPHPNADAIELARVGDYLSVVRKGDFVSGEKVAYIPEASLLPAWLIQHLGLAGKLAGPDQNRVHPVRLRGVLSQGICLKLVDGVLIPTANGPVPIAANDDLATVLGIQKFEPEIPDCLKGDVYPLESHERFNFDIDDIKRFPGVIAEGEPVSMTEKLHGICMMVVGLPAHLARPGSGHYQGRAIVSSKGLAAGFLGFAHTPENMGNHYMRAAAENGLQDKAIRAADRFGRPVAIFGEVFGSGVQDLRYGMENGKIQFRAFDIRVERTWLDDAELEATISELGIERVPVLYKGPFSKASLLEHTNGKTTFGGVNIREGVIVKPLVERTDIMLGRVVLKSVSEQYLLRKGGTEYS